MSSDLNPPPFHDPPISIKHPPPDSNSFPIKFERFIRASEKPTVGMPPPEPRVVVQPQVSYVGERSSDIAKGLWALCALGSVLMVLLFFLSGMNPAMSLGVMTLLIAGFVFCSAMDGALRS
jgi:hypothetical protein